MIILNSYVKQFTCLSSTSCIPIADTPSQVTFDLHDHTTPSLLPPSLNAGSSDHAGMNDSITDFVVLEIDAMTTPLQVTFLFSPEPILIPPHPR